MDVTVSDGETFYHHLTNSLYISDIRSKSDGDGEKCIKKIFCGRKRHSTTFSSIRLAKTKLFLNFATIRGEIRRNQYKAFAIISRSAKSLGNLLEITTHRNNM